MGFAKSGWNVSLYLTGNKASLFQAFADRVEESTNVSGNVVKLKSKAEQKRIGL